MLETLFLLKDSTIELSCLNPLGMLINERIPLARSTYIFRGWEIRLGINDTIRYEYFFIRKKNQIGLI